MTGERPAQDLAISKGKAMFFSDNGSKKALYSLTFGKYTIEFLVNRIPTNDSMFLSADVRVNDSEFKPHKAAFGYAANESGKIDAKAFSLGVDGAAKDWIKAEATSVLRELFYDDDDDRYDDFAKGLQSESAAKYRDRFENVSVTVL